jgi:deoxyribose-phosphate aldolase
VSSKIYKEVKIYGTNISENEVIDRSFKSIEYGVSGLSVSPNYVSKLSHIIPDPILIACPIDYPYGLSSTKIRQHETLSAIRSGATAIDLVVNPIYIINGEKQKISDDLEANKAICKENGVLFRIMLEYRQFDDDVYFELVKLCKYLRIEYIFPSTGNFVDDYLDNLIMCSLIQDICKAANVITNGNIWKKEHYDVIEKSNIYGIQLNFGYELEILK